VSDVLRSLQSYSIPNEAIGCLVQVVAYLVVRGHNALPALYASTPCCANQDQKSHLFKATCSLLVTVYSFGPVQRSHPLVQLFAPNVGNFSPVMLVRRYIDYALLALANLSRFCQHHCITGTHHTVPKAETAVIPTSSLV
jgi:hypothetical protein